MDLESCNGQMVRNTKVNSNLTREKGTVSSRGETDVNMRVDGLKVSRKEMVSIQTKQGNKKEAHGLKVEDKFGMIVLRSSGQSTGIAN